MKILTFLILALSLPALSAKESDLDSIRECLNRWDKHPFSAKDPSYRTIGAKVRVLGIGGTVQDTKQTQTPELVLIKPSVGVASKTVYELLNQNGWYCFKGNVTVLAKMEVRLACKAHIASENESVEIGAKGEESSGVTVLGKSVIKRIGCE